MTSTHDFLKKIPLFATLPPADLDRLCAMVTEERYQAGEELFPEGSPGDRAYVIKDGQLEVLKASGGRQVLLAVRQPGEVIGEMSLLKSAPRFATVRARTDCLLLAIAHEHLDHLLNTSPSAARAMLFTITARLRSTELVLRQSEKMAQLGTLTAGIAHELNNPAAAVQRGASLLQDGISHLQRIHLKLTELDLSQAQRNALLSLDEDARQRAAQPVDLDALDRSDREAAVEDWLDGQGIADGWELAPILVNLGYQSDQLDRLVGIFLQEQLPVIVQWLEASYTLYNLLEEITRGTAQMSAIVKALKSYVYLDQAPVQSIDLHESLDNTLVMLRGKLKGGIELRRDYAASLPHIQAYGSELNQVWTNLIDNAVDAMDGHGELILRTRQEGDWVIVEIQDNGPGIPPRSSQTFSARFSPPNRLAKAPDWA